MYSHPPPQLSMSRRPRMISDGIAVAISPVGCVGQELRMRELSNERSTPRGAEHAASAAGQGAGIPGGEASRKPGRACRMRSGSTRMRRCICGLKSSARSGLPTAQQSITGGRSRSTSRRAGLRHSRSLMEPEQSRSCSISSTTISWFIQAANPPTTTTSAAQRRSIASVPAGRPAEGGCDQRLGRGNERDGRALAEPAAYSRSSINRVEPPVVPDATEPVLVR